jgi:hypothetical protein
MYHDPYHVERVPWNLRPYHVERVPWHIVP